MSLSVVDESGVRVVEGSPDQRLMSRPDDAGLVLEVCFANRVRLALLYPENLTDSFFDLSSGEAGSILQKLRNYRVRLAIVWPPDTVRFSSRFGEMVAEEERGRNFAIFATRDAARAWLAAGKRQ